ncbi:MAG TPA: RNA polymerase-associated protein RapA [Hyphomicrobiales bacterium]|nr:RNA polymerase-associated protein RapA [Hyphomicrobiales bacterium]
MPYVTGQRFLCDAEPELGLGQIIEVGHRTLTLVFAASETTRQYAMHNSPLTRIGFEPGDQVSDRHQQRLEVLAVREEDDLLHYTVRDATGAEFVLPETELSPHLSLSQPLKRLLALQTEPASWFQLRRAALQAQAFIERSPLLGLSGNRTDLLPHQLYIASEVARRPAPRVLLSDEVGLGKTIEACLILQQQLFSGLAQRVLIVVPDSLVHQWLVELLRRFNLRFAIFDEERCAALEAADSTNPFDSEQLVLCSPHFLRDAPHRQEQILASQWDLLILDEAHHWLRQTDAGDVASPLVRQFSLAVPGMLLLTATPDQLGPHSYFTLLSLLDADRFHDFDAFMAEQARYRDLAALLDPLLGYAALTQPEREALLQQLEAFASDADLCARLQALREAETAQLAPRSQALLDALLDRHGTGRIAFRNTRRQVSGFPARRLQQAALPLPPLYQPHVAAVAPERQFGHDESWLKEDPRLPWLYQLLRAERRAKFLLICHTRGVAESLEAYLRLHRGIASVVFHEGLSLVERDRASAYFADPDEGAQLLVCSEIGSEGRNFQFSHHLVLFDLPEHPDLLEQRIGRLDRIGQQHDIQIHVPYFPNTAGSVLLRLYQSLGIFQTPNPVAAQLCHELRQDIAACLAQPDDEQACAALRAHAEQRNAQLLEQHLAGRDRLLELNSCRPRQAQQLLERIAVQEAEQSPEPFLQQVFASYGLEAESGLNATHTVRPADDMLLESFPLIPDEGFTYTLDRARALSRDDLPFVTWLHPLVLQSLDLVLQTHSGKCTVGLLRDKRLAPGTVVLESLYRVTVSAPAALQAKRWFPVSILRSVVDSHKRSIGRSLTGEQLDTRSQPLDRQHVRTLINERRPLIQLLHRLGRGVAEKQLPELIAERTQAMQQELDDELRRLRALQRVNPQVRQEELDYLARQREALGAAYASAELQLECLRLLLAV